MNSSRVCFYCKEEKAWNWHGERLKDGSRIYTDDTRQRWAGRRCPACEKGRVQKALKCDPFKRNLLITALQEQGFAMVSATLPLKASKADKAYELGIVHGATKDGKILLEKTDDKATPDLYAIVFQSVRLCTPEQFAALATKAHYFEHSEETPLISKAVLAKDPTLSTTPEG